MAASIAASRVRLAGLRPHLTRQWNPLKFQQRWFCDTNTLQLKRASEVTKNELMRSMLAACLSNQLKFRYVLLDSGYASEGNFAFIDKKGKQIIAALKDNCLVAQKEDDKMQGHLVRIDALPLGDKQAARDWLNGYGKEVLLVRRIFTNKEGSTGVLNLVSGDVTLDAESAAAIHQKRWKVAAFHKSLKSNAALEKSPTQTVTKQHTHVGLADRSALCRHWLASRARTRDVCFASRCVADHMLRVF